MKKYKDIAGDGGSNIVGQVEAQQARLSERLAAVHAVVAIVSGKGGVGKSSLTANRACCLALGGFRVGVLDADLNGTTMARMLGGGGQRPVFALGGVPFLGRVPFGPALAAAADRGEPFVARAPESAAARALTAVAEKIRAAIAAPAS